MRYIKKGKEPETLYSFRNLSVRNFSPSFENLPAHVIEDIILSLLQDQGWLCCYCMNEISSETARLVQFLPFKDESLNYSNLFLACNYSNNLPTTQQHCYIKKGTELIPKYMSDERCSEYFRYNTLGEILPSGTFRTVRKCKDNFWKLTPVQQAVLSAIEILNLNTDRLKDQRKAILQQIATMFARATKAQIQKAIEVFGLRDKTGKFKRYCEVVIYYLQNV
jgi:uncharacterized protein (TIGR02646 family)